MNKKITLIISFIIVFAVVLWFALPRSFADSDHGEEAETAQAEQSEGLVISDAQLEASDISLHRVSFGGSAVIVVPATVENTPAGSAQLDARADGTIRSIRKTHGDYVAQGEAVALIESSQAAQYSADVAAAQARLSQAQSAFNREQRLYDANVTARQDLEAAQAQLSIARADLNRAQRTARAAGVTGDGNLIAVTSPISGRVTSTAAVLGSFVTAGTELMRIVNPARIQIKASLPASDAARIAVGDRATIRVINGQEITAVVRTVTPALDEESRAAIAILEPSRLTPNLQPGAFVEAHITLNGQSDPDIIAVPEEAVQTIDGQTMVFVRHGQTFEPVEVTTGPPSGGRVTIMSGLQGGELIAAQNAFLLKADLEKEEAEHGH